jgi:hypothetical protein
VAVRTQEGGFASSHSLSVFNIDSVDDGMHIHQHNTSLAAHGKTNQAIETLLEAFRRM